MMLIVETITWKPHIETAMEIALRARDAGLAVVYCNLRRGLPICEDRHSSHALVDLPEIRIKRSQEVLKSQGVDCMRPRYPQTVLKTTMARALAMVASCDDISAIRKLRHEAFTDLGWAILSSATSMTRNSQITPQSHRELLVRLCAAAILVYDQTLALIQRHAPSEVMLFNGRFATTRGVLRAAEACSIPWRIHERGGDWHRFWTADCLPQDNDRIQELIQQSWRSDHVEAGSAFFNLRRQRVERAWHSFTRAQDPGRVPVEMQQPGEWVTFFTSSEDEMFAIGDRFENHHYPEQSDALSTLARAVASLPGLRLCVRVHPHISQKSAADKLKWANLRIPGALVIGADDSCDTYALIDRSSVVCTYGSTVGVEATFWRRPSLSFGRSLYDRLGVCEQAAEIDHVRHFLASPTVFPIDGALQYGAFFERLGEPYIHYRPDHFHRGSICGVYLDDAPTIKLAKWAVGLVQR